MDLAKKPTTEPEPEPTTPDHPTVEQVCAHMARHPADRYQEIIDMMEAMLATKTGMEVPSMAEILSNRENMESGPFYHGLLGLVERVENIRKATLKMVAVIDMVYGHDRRTIPGVRDRISDAFSLLESAAPSVISPDDIDDPEEGEEVEA